MSWNKGISGEQLQHDWLFTFYNNQKIKTFQYSLFLYLIGLITTSNSVLQLLRKTVYVAQTLCVCQEMWLSSTITLWRTGLLTQFRLQHCCKIDRSSAQPALLLRDPFLDMNVLGHNSWGVSDETLPQRKDCKNF